MEQKKVLIIGLGNIDRADDGVAWWIVNAIRKRLGLRPLGEYETGLEEMKGFVNAIFVHQLTPEILEDIIGYQKIIFVDAHTVPKESEVYVSSVTPSYESLLFSHHLTAPTLLAFLKDLYNEEPRAYIVSIRGHDFDFHRNLSPKTMQLLEPALAYIEQLLQQEDTKK
ncbi:MAG: hydrogenase maturation protease [Syntrophales bacterium]|nr:hydrogenase maturation protease [Syntrophales bacterium]